MSIRSLLAATNRHRTAAADPTEAAAPSTEPVPELAAQP